MSSTSARSTATHGVLRFRVSLEGEIIRKARRIVLHPPRHREDVRKPDHPQTPALPTASTTSGRRRTAMRSACIEKG